MGDLATFWGVLLAIAAGITALGGAWKYLRELCKPYDELKNRVIALERQNEKSKLELQQLEARLKEYIDERDDAMNETIQNIKEDVRALRKTIEANEQDTKLILKEIFHLSSYITTGDKQKLGELLGVNDEILNHLIDSK